MKKHDETGELVNGNALITTAEGTDATTDDEINALEDVNPAVYGANVASVDVIYARLIALVYTRLMKVSATLDAENFIA